MSKMRILEVIPKDIEVVFALPLEAVTNLESALQVAVLDLNTAIPGEKKAFDSVLEFHDLLSTLLKDMQNA